MTTIDTRLHGEVARQPYPLLFATVSGAHLYGFPSPDSDYDLRGVHLLPVHEVVGLTTGPETLEDTADRDGLVFDLVTHDVRKFFTMMLKRNGYVLEQLHSPLIVHTTPEHGELREIARSCVTRHHAQHYLGFARTQWSLFQEGQLRRVKPLLYTYRVLLTGMYLMRTGEVEANLVTLNEMFRLSFLADLIDRKVAGSEHVTVADADISFFEREYTRLKADLEHAAVETTLPDVASGHAELHDLLLRLRLTSRSA